MKKIFLLIVALVLMAVPAHAYLVDTGTPVLENDEWAVGNDSEYSIYSSVASRFVLANQSWITGVSGYFDPENLGTLTVALYKGDATDPVYGGLIPDVSKNIYSGTLNIDGVKNWYGISGIHETLDAGAYWVAFEGRLTDTFYGGMPSPAPNPLLNGAWSMSDSGVGNYNNYDSLNIGVRINGSVTPEPASFLLFSVGLAGVLLRRIRKV